MIANAVHRGKGRALLSAVPVATGVGIAAAVARGLPGPVTVGRTLLWLGSVLGAAIAGAVAVECALDRWLAASSRRPDAEDAFFRSTLRLGAGRAVRARSVVAVFVLVIVAVMLGVVRPPVEERSVTSRVTVPVETISA